MLAQPYGWQSDGSAFAEDYAPNTDACWKIEPSAEHAGKRIALSFRRFDVETRYDHVDIYDGGLVTARILTPATGLTGLALPDSLPASERGGAIPLSSLSRTSSGGSLLVEFHTDASRQESGFLFGWTVLPLPDDKARYCALDCAMSAAMRRDAGKEGIKGDGKCDPACMNAYCDFDGGDCDEDTQCAASCTTAMLGDGVCHPECLVASCNYDNRDCECRNVLETDAGYQTEGTSIGSTYDNSGSRCWLIRPKLAGVTSISLSFARFATEAYYDVLYVYDGEHQGARPLYPGGLSGTGLPRPVHSSGPAVLVRFVADATNTASGFLFGWTSTVAGAPTPPGQCGRKCKPSMLGNGLCEPECMFAECQWDRGDCWGRCHEATQNLILALLGGDITPCYSMQLGNGECDRECMLDECNYDGGDCGCQNVVTERAGFRSVVPSDGTALDSSRCWLIRPTPPAPGERVAAVTLSFQRFSTEFQYDILQIYDGPHALADRLMTPGQGVSGKIKIETIPPLVARRDGSMLVMYLSDGHVDKGGLLFGWTSALESDAVLPRGTCAFNCTAAMRGDGRCDPQCMNKACFWDAAREGGASDCAAECAPGCKQEQLGNGMCEPACASEACGRDAADCSCTEIYTECDGSLTDGSERSANYNNAASTCWLLRPRRHNARVRLSWERFDTEAGHDLVRVYDGSSRLDRPLHTGAGYSGSTLPPPTASSGPELLLTFTSDVLMASEKGFRFSWTCEGGMILDAAGAGGRTANLLTNPSMARGADGRYRGWELQDVGGAISSGTLPWAAAPVPVAGSAPPAPPCAAGADCQHDGFTRLGATALLGTCCDIQASGGGMLLAASSVGFLRVQTVDLAALGFSAAFLDRSPDVHAREAFAPLPPGSHDDYFLRLELLDAARHVLATWTPAASSAARGAPQCSSQCVLSRRGVDGAPPGAFWTNVTHTFSGYARGLRYVRWTGGGRDADAYGGHVGTLIKESHLTIQLDPAECAGGCGRHGACHAGRCECEAGWGGASCDAAIATATGAACGQGCSGKGRCVSGADGRSHCVCDQGYAGTYCTASTADAIVNAGVDAPAPSSSAPGGIVGEEEDASWGAFPTIVVVGFLLIIIYACARRAGVRPVSPRALMYDALGAWSRVRIVGEELAAGRIELKEAPARLAGHWGRPVALRRSEEEDTEGML